jgi:glycosyltransferase involved in cell wall biosynthesis
MPNIYAVIAKFFVPAKIITVRHNSDVMYLFGTKKEKWIEKIINRFSPCIIAISNKVKQQLIEFEGVKERKVVRINNGYDFSKYEGLSILKENNVLRDSYKNKFVILSPGRLIASKRHHLCIEAMPELLKFQPTIHLLIIGDGPEKKSFQLLIDKLDLSASVSIISYKENITDYIKIANVVVQLSISEASNNSIKEAAYFEKTCVVCKDVGDFSDYIIHNRSGFLLDKNNPKFELIECIKKMFSSEADYGKELKKEVLKQFSIDKIGMEYDELHRQILEMK